MGRIMEGFLLNYIQDLRGRGSLEEVKRNVRYLFIVPICVASSRIW